MSKIFLFQTKVLTALTVCARFASFSSQKHSGVIRWVLSNAAYIGAGDHLITLTAPTSGNLPYGVLLPHEIMGDVTSLESGLEVEFTPGSLRIPHRHLIIDFSNAARWFPKTFETTQMRAECIEANLSTLENALLRVKGGDGLAGVARHMARLPYVSESVGLNHYSRKALPILGRVMFLWKSGQLLEAIVESGGLLGLGPGLTPSGDDFLLGMMAALQKLRHVFPALGPRLRLVNNYMCSCQLNSTNEISAAFLRQAQAGLFPEKLIDLIVSLVRSPIRDTSSLLNDLSKLGATSGTDMATGLLFGGYLVLSLQAERSCSTFR